MLLGLLFALVGTATATDVGVTGEPIVLLTPETAVSDFTRLGSWVRRGDEVMAVVSLAGLRDVNYRVLEGFRRPTVVGFYGSELPREFREVSEGALDRTYIVAAVDDGYAMDRAARTIGDIPQEVCDTNANIVVILEGAGDIGGAGVRDPFGGTIGRYPVPYEDGTDLVLTPDLGLSYLFVQPDPAPDGHETSGDLTPPAPYPLSAIHPDAMDSLNRAGCIPSDPPWRL